MFSEVATWQRFRTRETSSHFSYYVKQELEKNNTETYNFYKASNPPGFYSARDGFSDDTPESLFKRRPDWHSYSPLKNYFYTKSVERVVFAVCNEIILCRQEYAITSQPLAEQRSEMFTALHCQFASTSTSASGFVYPGTSDSEPIVQQPQPQIFPPLSAPEFGSMPFESAKISLMLAFMTMIYDHDALADSSERLAPAIAQRLQKLPPLGRMEAPILASIIAQAICRYVYREIVTEHHAEPGFYRPANPYTCALIGGVVVPSVLLAVPQIAAFMANVSLPLQIVLPALLTVLGFSIGKFSSRNHDQDLQKYPVPTREQQAKVSWELTAASAAAFGMAAQMLTPVIIKSLLTSTITHPTWTMVATLLAPLGVSALTAVIVYFIITHLQSRGYVSQMPCDNVLTAIRNCFSSKTINPEERRLLE